MRNSVRTNLPSLFVGVLVILSSGLQVHAQDLTARDIVDLAVARAEEQNERGAEVGFEAVVEVITEFLDGDQEVEKVERETYRQYPLEGVVYEELIAKEGQPLDEDDANDEIERREEFAENVRKRREAGDPPVPEDENRVDFNQEFVDRYEFSIIGEEMIDGHPSWVIYLEPREGDLPVRRRIDHALNKSTGKIWISQEDYGLPRVEFEMRESVRFWGGILGSLRDTVGRLDFARVAEGV